jgi:hypothetical protein
MRGTIGAATCGKRAAKESLCGGAPDPTCRPMWNEPYLETCCRSALHRLWLCGGPGRPAGLKDGRCLERLAGLGLARLRPDGRYEPTAEGFARHAGEVLRRG